MDNSAAAVRPFDDSRPAEHIWAKRRRKALRFALSNPIAIVAGILLFGITAMVLFADLFPSSVIKDPYFASPIVRLKGPSSEHWFGTDSVGRDVFSRLVYGGQTSLGTAFSAVILAGAIGTFLGLVTGYFGGWVDAVVQRVIETVQAFPALILALLIISLVAKNEKTLNGLVGAPSALPDVSIATLPIIVIFIPSFTRIVRASVLGTKNADFVTAAQTIGATPARILGVHILPNVSAPILVLASLTFGTAILVEASLSFLGLGTQPPDPSWGAMLAGDGRRFLNDHPHLVVAPAGVISIVVLAVNLLGDTVRDALDPVLRNR